MRFLRNMDRKRAARSGVLLFTGVGASTMVGALIALPWWLSLLGTGFLSAGYFALYETLERWS